MNFISETQIDQVTDQLEAERNQDEFFTVLGEGQPILLSFLVSDNIKVLTPEEQELMYLLATIIYKTIATANPDCPMIDEDLLGKTEEQNWSLLESNVRGSFSERITPFFKDYPQEDLLAFVEDSLVSDEDSQVTNEGRSYLFVVLKTMIDAFHKVA